MIRLIEFPKVEDPRGNLTFLQSPLVPFTVARVFWTYDVPGDSIRGGHAYHNQSEIIISLSGSFDVVVTTPDGLTQRFPLKRSYYGLLIPPLTWRHMENFSTNAFSLHLSSHNYNGDDYIRDFEKYRELMT